MPNENERRFGISAVAQITGLTTHTIRAWENRYDAVAVDRTDSGRRVYSESTVARLQMLSRLIRLGHRIGDLAGLADEELKSLLTEGSGRESSSRAAEFKPLRIAIMGAGSASLARALAAHPDACKVVLTRPAPLPLGPELSEQQIDALILQLPSVTPAATQELIDVQLRYREARVVLVYSFARERDLQVLRARGILLQRSPATTTDLLTTLVGIRENAVRLEADEPAQPLFSAAALDELAALPSAIDCQCPQHLASLVSNLVAFEQYSADCENRNEADAALHALLCREVGRARQIVETNLQRVIDAEGIVLTAA